MMHYEDNGEVRIHVDSIGKSQELTLRYRIKRAKPKLVKLSLLYGTYIIGVCIAYIICKIII